MSGPSSLPIWFFAVPSADFIQMTGRGGVRQTGDSLWLDLSHFDLPASTGKGAGKVVWGSDLPTRYDLRVVGDSVSLSDVNWVYPDLPKTERGLKTAKRVCLRYAQSLVNE